MSRDSSRSKTRSVNPDPASVLSARRAPLLAPPFIPEPALEFGDHQQLADPRVGLGIHGPFDRHEARHTPIRLGLIGTGPLIDKTRQWIAKCQSSVPAIRRITRKGSTLEVPTDPAAVPT